MVKNALTLKALLSPENKEWCGVLQKELQFLAELNHGKECKGGGLTHINGKEGPRRKPERVIVSQ